ncbi:MAG: 23S rRNA (adenine(2503)-C(2))-methyltransferase RlmN [Draconibacterium sp.]|nr:MAG: 23S rRNA (adenine(2503)-C(2))-methyltransferase RlmN [Draconibacterium sp.]
MAKESLFGKTLNELQEVVKELNLPKFTANQIADWLYKKNISAIDDMTNLSKKARELLNEKFKLGLVAPIKVQQSVDGTKKYLFPTHGLNYIETAMIPEKERKTVCVSSQVGCKMGCFFCFTAKQGFQGQLSTGDILNQIYSLPEFDKLTNIVFMGMGEPLDNLEQVLKAIDILTADYALGWSPKRITVSTIGILPQIHTFLETSKAHLALSMHNPFDDERRKLMPSEIRYPLASNMQAIKQHDFSGQRRVSFEYIMFEGVNDSLRHADEIVRLVSGLSCRVNLIRFHPIPNTPLKGTSDAQIEVFQNRLKSRGVMTTLRASRGMDILAACGMLSTKKQTEDKK